MTSPLVQIQYIKFVPLIIAGPSFFQFCLDTIPKIYIREGVDRLVRYVRLEFKIGRKQTRMKGSSAKENTRKIGDQTGALTLQRERYSMLALLVPQESCAKTQNN